MSSLHLEYLCEEPMRCTTNISNVTPRLINREESEMRTRFRSIALVVGAALATISTPVIAGDCNQQLNRHMSAYNSGQDQIYLTFNKAGHPVTPKAPDGPFAQMNKAAIAPNVDYLNTVPERWQHTKQTNVDETKFISTSYTSGRLQIGGGMTVPLGSRQPQRLTAEAGPYQIS